MKTRIVAHIGFNKKGKKCCALVNAGGRFLGFTSSYISIWMKLQTREWHSLLSSDSSVASWKRRVKQDYEAVRFQRVIIDGESS